MRPTPYIRLSTVPQPEVPPQGSVDIFYDQGAETVKVKRYDNTTISFGGGGVSTFAELTDKVSATIATTNTSVADALAAKAPLVSPTFTGTPAAPTATVGTNTTQVATTAFVKTAVDNVIASAPGALNTLDELAAALGDDANFASTVTTALAGKGGKAAANTWTEENTFTPADFTGFTVTTADGTLTLTSSGEGDVLVGSSAGATQVFSGALGTLTNFQFVNCRVPVTLAIDVGDETTSLTTGTAKKTFRMPHAMTLTGVRASVKTAPTGSTIIVDINEGGASIFSTRLSIDASEKTSTTAASAAVLSDTALADDAEITIDIDQVGSSVAGVGLKVWLIGTR